MNSKNGGYQYAAVDLVTVVTALVTVKSLCIDIIYSIVTRVTSFFIHAYTRARTCVRCVFSGNSGNFDYKNIFIRIKSLKSAVTSAVTSYLISVVTVTRKEETL